MATAHMLRLDKHELAARAGMTEYIRRCQASFGLGATQGQCHSTLASYKLEKLR